jgi:hypothetical protein
MKYFMNLQNYEELTINLLKTHLIFNSNKNFDDLFQYKMIYELIIKTGSFRIKNNLDIKNCLLLHLDCEFFKSYELLMSIYNDNMFQFYSKLIFYLLQLEFLEYIKKFSNYYEFLLEANLFGEINEDNIGKVYSKWKREFLNKRSELFKFFRIDKNFIIERIESIDRNNSLQGTDMYKREENKIYSEIIDLLEVR